MKVRISIEQEFDVNNDLMFVDDDPMFDEYKNLYTIDDRIDLLLSRFLEDIDYLVKYDQVSDAVKIEYIED
jgi:hypothetical protein